MAKNWQHKKSRYQNNTLSIYERRKKIGKKGDKRDGETGRDISKNTWIRQWGIYQYSHIFYNLNSMYFFVRIVSDLIIHKITFPFSLHIRIFHSLSFSFFFLLFSPCCYLTLAPAGVFIVIHNLSESVYTLKL